MHKIIYFYIYQKEKNATELDMNIIHNHKYLLIFIFPSHNCIATFTLSNSLNSLNLEAKYFDQSAILLYIINPIFQALQDPIRYL